MEFVELNILPLARTLEVPVGACLLDVLAEHEIPVSYSCKAGRCETCRVKVVHGNLQEAEAQQLQEEGDADRYMLACQSFLTEPCTIEIMEPDEVVVHPARIIKGTVETIESLTDDIVRLRLRPNKSMEFSPGQYANLQFAPEYIRPYSMAGVCTDDIMEFHVRLVPDGRVSGFISNQLRVGASVRVSGPMGTAYLRRKHDGPMLCIAGGTGLAPILSIVRGVIDAGMSNPIHVYVGARSPQDVYGLDVLEALRKQYADLHVHVVVTSREDDKKPGYREGFVTDAVDNDWPDLIGWRAYLCGSPPMVEAAALIAKDKGVAPEHIYADAFYASND